MDSDSDFYGDEEAISVLNKKVKNLDIKTWWEFRDSMLILTSCNNQNTPLSGGRLHNSCEGRPGARELSETVDEFLTRLPPANTDASSGAPWLWIANPYILVESKSDLGALTQGGMERLELFTNFIQQTEKNSKSPFVARRQISEEREAVIQDLRDLAGECNVVGGKWMLFPDAAAVNRVWGIIAHATANNELGVIAKVDTRAYDRERLICVYTKDFRDKDDVARVLNRLRQLELVRAGGRQIYYKSDAWTYLNLYSRNEWNIPASTYSSNELFTYIKEGVSK